MTLEEYNRRLRELQNTAAPYEQAIALAAAYLRGVNGNRWKKEY